MIMKTNADPFLETTVNQIFLVPAYYEDEPPVYHAQGVGGTVEEFNPVIGATIVYLTMILLGTVGVFLIQAMFKKCPNYGTPPSLWWFCLGIFMSLMVWHLGSCHHTDCDVDDSYFVYGFYEYFINVDSHVVYLLLLPPLLYEGALGTNLFKFQTLFASSLFMATVGVAITGGVLGLLFSAVMPSCFENSFEPYLMGATLSSTDPVAVISVLKLLGFPQKIMTYFEGESLLNDGTSVVMFELLKELAMGTELTGAQIFGKVCYLFFLSPLWGIGYGMVVSFLDRFFTHEHNTFEAIWFTMHCSLCFVIGEVFMELSGPLASVSYGLWVNFYGFRSLDRQAYHVHHEFVQSMATICEMLIFELSGAIVTFLVLDHDPITEDLSTGNIFSDGVMAWIFMLLVRLDIFAFLPLLNWFGPYHLNLKEATLLWWGGLRGAIVLALAHMLHQDERLSIVFTHEIPVRIAIAVGFNLIVQGTGFSFLVRMINPYPPNEYQVKSANNNFPLLDDAFHRQVLDRFVASGLCIPALHNDVRLHDGVGRRNTVRECDFADVLHPRHVAPKSVCDGLFHTETIHLVDQFDDLTILDGHLKLSQRQSTFIAGVKDAMSFECGLGLRLFLPRYLGVTTYKTNFKYLESANDHVAHSNVITNSTPDLVDAVLRKIPGLKNLMVDIRGNLKYDHSIYTPLDEAISVWVKHTSNMCWLDDSIEPSRKLFAKEIDDVSIYEEDLEEMDEEDIMTQRLASLKSREKYLIIANMCLQKYHSLYTAGLLNNAPYANLCRMCEASVLQVELDLEQMKRDPLLSVPPTTLAHTQWRLLKPKLNIIRYLNGKNKALLKYRQEGKIVWRVAVFRQCVTDLESILNFVDMHERIVVLRASTFSRVFLNFPDLLTNYHKVIHEAVDLLLECMNQYGDVFHASIYLVLARSLAREKLHYIKNEFHNGHLSEKAAHTMEEIIDLKITDLQEYKDFRREPCFFNATCESIISNLRTETYDALGQTMTFIPQQESSSSDLELGKEGGMFLPLPKAHHKNGRHLV
eukprot:GHVH01004604.1.p1 GENE.GHVH01004604.1~~GHVH01004604.1.p1  ORF type:complete len:1033 (-),score=143.15 GHVH01004604.1:186-3284(-)